MSDAVAGSESIDTLYQLAVDDLARQALACGKDEILDLPDDKTLTVTVAGQQVSGWMRHLEWSNSLHHVVFSLTRKTWLGIYRLYLGGIKLDSDSQVSLLINDELAEYD